MKTLTARMGNIKSGELIDPESSESLSDVESTLSGLGVKLRDSNSEFRNFGDVLDEVAGNWDNYSSVQQRALAVAFSGTRQQEKFLVLMENYDDAMRLAGVSAQSFGTSVEKFNAYADSMEAKINALKTSFLDLSNSLINTDLLKGVVDLLNSITQGTTKAIDTIGLLPTVLAGVALGGFVANINSIKSAIQATAETLVQFKNGFDSLDEVVVSLSNLSKAQQQVGVSLLGLNEEQKKYVGSTLAAIASGESLMSEQLAQIVSTSTLSSAEQNLLLTKLNLVGAEKQDIVLTKQEWIARLKAAEATDVENAAAYRAMITQLEKNTVTKAAVIDMNLLTASIWENIKAVWANIKAIGVWMLTTPAGALTALIALVGGGAIAWSKYSKSQEEALQKQKSELSEYKTELEDLVAKQRETIASIEELNKLRESGDITQAQRNQLELQENTLANLDREIKYRKELIAVRGKDVNDKTVSQLNNMRTSDPEFPVGGSRAFGASGAGNMVKVDTALAKYTKLIQDADSALSKLNKKYDDGIISAEEYATKLAKLQSDKTSVIDAGSKIVDNIEELLPYITDSVQLDFWQSVVDGFKNAITNAAGEASDALGGVSSAAYEAAESVSPVIDNLGDKISSLADKYSALETAQKEIKETNGLTLNTLESLLGKYPELAEEIQDYIAGVSDVGTLESVLKEQYANDAENLKEALAEKQGSNQEFYEEMLEANGEAIDEFSKEYDVDLRNYKTYNDAKKAIGESYANLSIDIQNDIHTALTKCYSKDLETYNSYLTAKANGDASLIKFLSNLWSDYYNVTSGTLTTDYSELSRLAATGDEKAKSQLKAIREVAVEQQKAAKATKDLSDLASRNIDFKFDSKDKSGGGSESLFDGKDIDLTGYEAVEAEIDRISSSIDRLKDKMSEGDLSLVELGDLQAQSADELTKLDAVYDSYIEKIQSRQDELQKTVEGFGINVSFDDDGIAVLDGYQEKLDELAEAYKKAAKAAEGSSKDSALAKQAESIKEEYDKLTNSVTAFVDENNKLYDAKHAMEDYADAVEDAALAALQKAKSAITELQDMIVDMLKQQYQDTIDALDKEEDAIKDRFDGEKDALEQAQNSYEDAWDDRMDALEDWYDQEKENLELEDDLIEALEEEADLKIKALEAQKKAADDAYDAEKKRLDLMKQSLERGEDEHDYQAELAERTDEISGLENQIGILSNDDSLEATKKRNELEEQLAEKRKELEEYIHDRQIELQQETIDDALDALDEKHNKETEAIDNAIDKINEETEARKKAIEEEYELKDKLLQQDYDARKKALEAEKEATQDLYDARKKALEDEEELQLKSIDAQKEAAQTAMNDTYALRMQALSMIENKESGLYEQLIKYNQQYGDSIDQTVDNAWRNCYTTMEGVEGLSDSLKGILEELSVDNLGDSLDKVITNLDLLKNKLVDIKNANKQTSNNPVIVNDSQFDEGTWEHIITNHSGGLVSDSAGRDKLSKLLQMTGKIGSGEFVRKLTGDELVLTAKQQQALMGGLSASSVTNNTSSPAFNFTMPINIAGNADSSAVAALKDAADGIVQKVMRQINKQGYRVNSRVGV